MMHTKTVKLLIIANLLIVLSFFSMANNSNNQIEMTLLRFTDNILKGNYREYPNFIKNVLLLNELREMTIKYDFYKLSSQIIEIEEITEDKINAKVAIEAEISKKDSYFNPIVKFYSNFTFERIDNQWYVTDTNFYKKITSTKKIGTYILIYLVVAFPFMIHASIKSKTKEERVFWIFAIGIGNIIGLLYYYRKVIKKQVK